MDYFKIQELAIDLLEYAKEELLIQDYDVLKEAFYKACDFIELANIYECEDEEEE